MKRNMEALYPSGSVNSKRVGTDTLFADDNVICRFEGILDKTIKYITDFQLLSAEHWKRFVEQFRLHSDSDTRGWRGEYFGKMMRGATFVYTCTRDKALYAVLRDAIEDILTTEDELGRISSFSVEKEFDGWDIWCRKYVLLGMQYFMEICTDEDLNRRLIASMKRQVDYMSSKLGYKEDGKKPITSASRHWRGVNSSSVLEPVVRLYDLTGEEKYLDFARYIVDEGGTSIANIFEIAYEDLTDPYQFPIVKAYETTSCFEGLLEYYRATGDVKYREAVINFASRLLETDVTVIGSCGCTHELLDHSAARQHDPALAEDVMQETCVTVTLMKFCRQLLSLTGDPKYADCYETALYNAYLGSVNTEKNIDETFIKSQYPDAILEPLPFDSYSALTLSTRGRKIGGLQLMPDNHYYGCCACIGAAGIGLLSKMTAMLSSDGVALNLYIPGSITTTTPLGQNITVNTVTDYPADGKITLTLGLAEAEELTLSLRIPAWSERTEISVNGEAVAPNCGYTDIRRTFKNGDCIELMLDMRTRVIQPIPNPRDIVMTDIKWDQNYSVPRVVVESPEAMNQIALCRGPLTLARDARLGQNVREAVDIKYDADGYVEVIPSNDADFDTITELEVPNNDGTFFKVIDYASAGKTWDERSLYGCWLPTK